MGLTRRRGDAEAQWVIVSRPLPFVVFEDAFGWIEFGEVVEIEREHGSQFMAAGCAGPGRLVAGCFGGADGFQGELGAEEAGEVSVGKRALAR